MVWNWSRCAFGSKLLGPTVTSRPSPSLLRLHVNQAIERPVDCMTTFELRGPLRRRTSFEVKVKSEVTAWSSPTLRPPCSVCDVVSANDVWWRTRPLGPSAGVAIGPCPPVVVVHAPARRPFPRQQIGVVVWTRPCPCTGPPRVDVATFTVRRWQQPRISPGRRDKHLGIAFLRRLETCEAVTRQSAKTASVSVGVAELERSSAPRSTIITSCGWRRTGHVAPIRPTPVVFAVEVDVRSPLSPTSESRASMHLRRCPYRPIRTSWREPRGTVSLHYAPVATHVSYVVECQPRPVAHEPLSHHTSGRVARQTRVWNIQKLTQIYRLGLPRQVLVTICTSLIVSSWYRKLLLCPDGSRRWTMHKCICSGLAHRWLGSA